MGIWSEIKYALNSTLGTGYKESLDVLLGAKIACRGYIGAKFTLTDSNGYFPEKTVEITENSKVIDEEIDVRVEIVPVHLSTYSIKIELGNIIVNATVSATESGKTYTFSYSKLTTLSTLTASGTVSVPEGTDYLYVTAIAGGGGGGGGAAYSAANFYAGGGGGGCGYFTTNKPIRVQGLSEFPVTIGSGGGGGAGKSGSDAQGTSGTSGGATIIGNFFTLTGGNGGGGASIACDASNRYGASPGGGGSGGYYGGSGGYCNRNSSTDYYNGANGGGSAGGTAESSSGYGTAGGGGGAGYKLLSDFTGTGGNGGGKAATIYGGGGGGGTNSNSGGAGKSGYAIIYKGVYVR